MIKGPVAKNVDAYLARCSPEARAALEKLRKTIKAAAPKATEVISYHIPIFKHDGMLVGFAAFQKHCSFFPMSYAVMRAHQAELADFEKSKGTVRFTPEKPLPAGLVKKIVKARLKENEARRKKREGQK